MDFQAFICSWSSWSVQWGSTKRSSAPVSPLKGVAIAGKGPFTAHLSVRPFIPHLFIPSFPHHLSPIHPTTKYTGIHYFHTKKSTYLQHISVSSPNYPKTMGNNGRKYLTHPNPVLWYFHAQVIPNIYFKVQFTLRLNGWNLAHLLEAIYRTQAKRQFFAALLHNAIQ